MNIPFSKYQGTGNDFVVIDNRDGLYNHLETEQVRFLCDRRWGVGGDGLMLLNNIPGYDFDMKYFNSDGKPGSMCGNGGRCIAQFAHHLGLIREKARFTAVDGEHEATLESAGEVRLRMAPVRGVVVDKWHYILDTGSPHYVQVVDDIETVNVASEGAAIRYSAPFAAKGININFVQVLGPNSLYVRTYERGVEAETYSCGTGVTAAALVHPASNGHHTIQVKTLGGSLRVECDKKDDDAFDNIWLCGPAAFVFKGEITISI